ncbi:MAG: hypothetical protein ACXVCP_05670 [Bdellovibrio sp.]
MEKYFLNSFLAFSFIILTACSGAEPDNTDGIDSNSVTSGSFTTYNNSKIEGSGTILFTEVLTLNTSRSIALAGSLDSASGSSTLSAVFYSGSNNITTTDGIAVTFIRSGSNVNVQISYNGNSAMVDSSKTSFYFPASLDLIIDIHNYGSQARVLIWRRNSVQYTAASADVDTSRTGDMVSTLPLQKGSGIYAGLILQNATVISARLGTQKVAN